MGYWGDRAKDGDQPLDLLAECLNDGIGKKHNLTPVQFVKKQIKEAEAKKQMYIKKGWHDELTPYFPVIGMITLLVEKGRKFSKAVYHKCLEELYAMDDASKEDIEFFRKLLGYDKA